VEFSRKKKPQQGREGKEKYAGRKQDKVQHGRERSQTGRKNKIQQGGRNTGSVPREGGEGERKRGEKRKPRETQSRGGVGKTTG